jgi:hypothetical protein
VDTGSDNSARIRELNDTFRRSFVGGVVLVTQGVEGPLPGGKVRSPSAGARL